MDIVVSEAIDTGSAAIAALVSEVNKGNKVTINNNTDVTSVTEGAQLRASCDDAPQRGAIAPSRPSANERIDDSTPLSKVATRLGAGVACGALTQIVVPGSLWLTALFALAGMLIIHAIAIRYDHR